MFIGRSNHWTGGSRVQFLPGAWKFPLKWRRKLMPITIESYVRGLRRSYALPTGFHADIMIRRSSGLFLILSITVANWSTPWPLYSACMLMYLAPKWRHWNPYTGPRSPSSRSCKPKQKFHWDVDHEQYGWGRGSPLLHLILHLTSQIYLTIIHECTLDMSWL